MTILKENDTMKKNLLLAFISFIFISTSCSLSYEKNLNNMGESVRQHIRYNDEKNEVKTVIEILKPISYEEIPVEQRKQADDTYLCNVYVKAKWSYLVGSRVYNMNDTLKCIFDKKMSFIRIDKDEN